MVATPNKVKRVHLTPPSETLSHLKQFFITKPDQLVSGLLTFHVQKAAKPDKHLYHQITSFKFHFANINK